MICLPLVTVLMPVRNEVSFIRRSLEAVLVQDYPHERMEVLVADGLSEDGTRAVISQLQKEYETPTITIIDNPGRIVPTGLNAAILIAKGEIFIRVDGHCEISPSYVRNCVEILETQNVDGVGGPIETIGKDQLSQSIALAMSSPFGVGGSAFRTIKDRAILTDSVPFPAYTRQIIIKVGLFDEELVRNQDDEYNYRIRKLGGKILLSPDIRSRYHSRGSLKKLWRQYYQYGYWKVRVLQKHPHQMRPRQFVPPAFVLALIASALLALLSFVRLELALSEVERSFFLYLSSVIPLLYLTANLLASFWIASKRGWQYLPLLPVTFAILHLSYGFGFLVGLIRFWNRWGDKKGKVPVF